LDGLLDRRLVLRLLDGAAARVLIRHFWARNGPRGPMTGSARGARNP